MSFLSEILESTKELESPRNFWYWSGLATLSAIAKDSVWIPRGESKDKELYKLYPNIYVLLHADSGMKKGPPVSMAKKLVKMVNNTLIISGRSSIQGILKELGTARTLPGGKVSTNSTAFICASEFSSSIVEDKYAMTILTDLYDRQYNEGDWASLLKMEQFQLRSPTVSLLVATNEAHFSDFVQGKDVQGGFIGRMFVISEKEVQKLNPLIFELDAVPDYDHLIEHLREISKLKGPFESLKGSQAGRIYHDWYMSFYENVRKTKLKDDTGTVQRFGDSVLKVAMLIALSDKPELVISKEVMLEAIERCELLIGNARKTTMGSQGKSSLANQKAMIITELLDRDNHMVSRDQLLKKYWMHFGADELNEMTNSFEQSGLITIEMHGNQMVYVMPELIVQELLGRMKKK